MKNKTKKRLGVVAAMLGLVVAIGATAGTTLAKYISSATVESQQATVAQWGYTLTADVTNMFGEKYGAVNNKFAKVNGEGTVVASSESGKDVVAPGTYGYMTLTMNGTAEVNAVLTIDLSKFENIYLKLSGANSELDVYYYPINWYVGGSQVEADNNAVAAADIAAAISEKVEDQIEGAAVSYKADAEVVNVFLPAGTVVSGLDLSITWKWAFEVEDDTKDDINAMDTLLGLISYGAKTHAELPENIQNWLFDKYIELNNVTAYADAKAALAEAESALNTAKTDLDTAKANYADAYKKLAEAKAASEVTGTTIPADIQSAYDNAYAALFGKAAGENAEEDPAVPGAQEKFDVAQTAYNNAYVKADNAKASVVTSVTTYYETLIVKESNSNVKITLGLSATVVQTQIVDAEAFLAQYPNS